MASEPCLLGSAITAFRERRSGRSSMDRLPAHVRGDSSSGQAATAQCARIQPVIACAAEQEHAIGLLEGVVVAHHGSSYRRPGYSSLKVVQPRSRVHHSVGTEDRGPQAMADRRTRKQHRPGRVDLRAPVSRRLPPRMSAGCQRTQPNVPTRRDTNDPRIRETSVITGHIDTQEDGTARLARNQLF
jgi:hypothetical protein